MNYYNFCDGLYFMQEVLSHHQFMEKKQEIVTSDRQKFFFKYFIGSLLLKIKPQTHDIITLFSLIILWICLLNKCTVFRYSNGKCFNGNGRYL